MDETKHDRWYRLIPKQLKLLKEKLVKCPSQLLPRLSASSPYSCSRVTCRNVTNFSVNNFGCSSINCQQLSSSSSSNYNNDISVYWWSRRHQTKPQTVHSPSQQQLQQRYISLLVKPETSNKTSDRAIAVAAATTWNRLPLKVRTATSTEQFSHALKTHLFTLDWSCGSLRRLWLVISIDELWRRIQTERLRIGTACRLTSLHRRHSRCSFNVHFTVWLRDTHKLSDGLVLSSFHFDLRHYNNTRF